MLLPERFIPGWLFAQSEEHRRDKGGSVSIGN